MAQLDVPQNIDEAQAGQQADGGFSDKISVTVEDRVAVAQVVTVTVDSATNDTIYGITVNGVRVTFTSDADATETEIVAGLVAAAVASSFFTALVTATDADPDIVITAQTPGTALTVVLDDETTGDLSQVATTANVTVADNIAFGLAVFEGSAFDLGILPDGAGTVLGISILSDVIPIPRQDPDAQLNAGGEPVYKPTQVAGVMRQGRIHVDPEVTPVLGDGVFARHTATAGTTRGALTNVDDANTQAVPNSRWVRLSAFAGLAVVEISHP